MKKFADCGLAGGISSHVRIMHVKPDLHYEHLQITGMRADLIYTDVPWTDFGVASARITPN